MELSFSKNLYHHFRGVANFVKDIPFTTAGFQRAKVETTPENLGAVGQHGNGLTILWIRNKAHTTYNVVNKLPMPPVERGEVRVQGFKSGSYRVEFWDTYEGRVTGSMEIQVTNGTLKIAVPRLEKDFAVKVFPG